PRQLRAQRRRDLYYAAGPDNLVVRGIVKGAPVATVTKREKDGQHPASHYLVVADPKSPGTWHLRVLDITGKPDHGLMGAAWAALHKGYRGQQYAGPSKTAALKKLSGLYRSEGMETPA